MKKLFVGIILFLSFLSLPVYAVDDYDLYQLIPINKHANVETDHFIYKDFYYNDNEMQRESLHSNHIIFKEIVNKTKDTLPVSISVGFFDKDKKNIGTLNYCGTKEDITFAAKEIGPEATVPYSMVVMKTDLIDKKDLKDIVYIAVLGENRTCSTGKVSENSGRTAEEIKAVRSHRRHSNIRRTDSLRTDTVLWHRHIISFTAAVYLYYRNDVEYRRPAYYGLADNLSDNP